MAKPAAFSRVSLEWRGTHLEGIITPTGKSVRLKLDSGYNVGLDAKHVSNVKVLAPPPQRESLEADDAQRDIEDNSIMLIHTGGTIASKVDYATGAVYPSFSSKDMLSSYPGLAQLGPIHARQISNIVSEDLRFTHINAIAKEIDAHRDDDRIAGFIITHGTDTMHYTASALSFILGGLDKPVILTGAQRSSDRPSSDARLNLRSSALAIRDERLTPAVYVCMHSSITDERCALILGVSARKMHSSRRDAFESINRPPVALIDPRTDEVALDPEFSIPEQDARFMPLDEKMRVSVLVSRPNLYADDVTRAAHAAHGLIIEGSGFGHLPVSEEVDEENGRILDAVKDVAARIPIVMTRRTVSGVTNLNVYTPGRRLRDAGVIGHGLDCTPETAYVKLCWALANHPKHVREVMEANVCGEHTDAREIA